MIASQIRLLIADEIPIAGGVETIRRHLVPVLRKKCEAVVLAVPGNRLAEIKHLDWCRGVTVETLAPQRWTNSRAAGAVLRRLPFRKLKKATQRIILATQTERLRELKTKHAVTHVLAPCIWSQPVPRLDVPSAGILCDLYPGLPADLRANMARWIEEADCVFAISEFTAKMALANNVNRQSKIQRLPLAASLCVSQPRFQAPDVPFFFYPATALERKDHFTLFRAFAALQEKHPTAKLTLCGAGTEQYSSRECLANPALEEARMLLHDSGLLAQKKVEILGQTDWSSVEAIYRRSPCVVLPSRFEGFGLPLAEAFAYGLPVICSRIEPFIEQVELYQMGDMVRFFAPGDWRALAGLMADYASQKWHPQLPDSDLRQRLSRWTWDDIADRVLAKLASL